MPRFLNNECSNFVPVPRHRQLFLALVAAADHLTLAANRQIFGSVCMRGARTQTEVLCFGPNIMGLYSKAQMA
jgi:hypothetical protein